MVVMIAIGVPAPAAAVPLHRPLPAVVAPSLDIRKAAAVLDGGALRVALLLLHRGQTQVHKGECLLK